MKNYTMQSFRTYINLILFNQLHKKDEMDGLCKMQEE
jgi:hypothetical protein